MKNKLVFIIAMIVLIVLVIYSSRPIYKNNNTVFTEDLFSGVDSAYVTMYGLDPFKEIEGTTLKELCRKLSAIKIEDTDESMYLRDGEIIVGGPWKLVFTYNNGDTVSLEFRENLIRFVDSPEDKNVFLEQNYKVVDKNIKELILSYF